MRNNQNKDDTFKPSSHNPFARQQQQPNKPKTKQYQLPDPAKKQDCGQDRPIKMNPSGGYNLNFIDWQNEFDAVNDFEGDSDEPEESPIYGMDIKTFEAIQNEG